MVGLGSYLQEGDKGETAERRHCPQEKALAAYKTYKFTLVVPGGKQAQLGFLNPELQNRMKDFKPAEKDAQEQSD